MTRTWRHAFPLALLVCHCTVSFPDLPDPSQILCDEGERRECVEQLGECAQGHQVCTNGQWGACDTKTEELCDGLDNDCDGQTDEEFQLASDPEHCGACGVQCSGAHAAVACEEGRCVVTGCLDGYADADGTPANGCECLPTGGETCDGLDNDCNGQVDELFALQTDPDNCGGCGRVCRLDHARHACVGGDCVVVECLPGHWNTDGLDSNGCEYACEPTEGGAEVCDYQDNDCDGEADDGFDTRSDPRHCGACGNACDFPKGFFECREGRCGLVNCEAGFVDLDGVVENGCEYPCVVTGGGTEACDEADNDCDGETDEDVDLLSDVGHCGGCGRRCDLPHAVAACEAGRCRIGACEPGFVDANVSPADGCEAPCGPELCNGVDDDCNGDVDETFGDLGLPCTSGLGACRRAGVYVCTADGSGVRCGATAGQAGEEVCDGLDNDCNGLTDEGFDLDEDGHTSCGGDCDDGDAAVYPEAPELCDGKNNDCDDEVDEGIDVSSDPDHCGRCGHACELPHAVAGCQEGRCTVSECRRGFFDADEDPSNGCEYACLPTEPPDEVCDLRDNDCDGQTDEGYGVGTPCDGGGACGLGLWECWAGGVAGCSTSPGGTDERSRLEECDERDDDCDGAVDEDFDLDTDVSHCGRCNQRCELPHAAVACQAGTCVVAACDDGYQDLDGVADNGCEYECLPTDPPEELCDGRDNDCDAETDEGWDVRGVCEGVGACGIGVLECGPDGRSTRCSVMPGGSEDASMPELCDGRDNDCDGNADEEVSPALVQDDPRNCGACGSVCLPRPNATAACEDGECRFVCQDGWLDGDGLPGNGCEVDCAEAGEVEVGDGGAEEIRQAIRDAGPCGTVRLRYHWYEIQDGPIVIDVPGLTLRGGGHEPAELYYDAWEHMDEPVLQVTANHVTLESMSVSGPEPEGIRAIRARDVKGLTLREIGVNGGSDCWMERNEGVGPFSTVLLERVVDAVVEGLLAWGDLRWSRPGGCSPRDVSVLEVVGSRRVMIEGAHIRLWNSLDGHAGWLTAAIALAWTTDSVIRDSTVEVRRGGARDQDDEDGYSGPAYLLALHQSDRNLVEGNTFAIAEWDDGCEGWACSPRPAAVLLAGRDNTLRRNRLGLPDPPEDQRLPLGIDVHNTHNTLEANTFHGDPLVFLHGERGPVVEDLHLTQWGRPTSLGRIVVLDSVDPVIRDNVIEPPELGMHGYQIEWETEAFAGIYVEGATRGVVEDNVVGHSQAPACRVSGIHVVDSPGLRLSSNVLSGVVGDRAPDRCDAGDVPHHAGIRVEDSPGVRILDNLAPELDARAGLVVIESPDAEVAGTVLGAAGSEGSHHAGIYLADSDRAVLRRNLLHDRGSWAGVAVVASDGVRIEQGLIRMSGDIAGVHADDAGGLVLDNLTVAGRPDAPNGVALRGVGGSEATARSCIFAWLSQVGADAPEPWVTLSWSDWWQVADGLGGLQPGEGLLEVDPLFVAPDAGDLHLQPGSPCIDAGDPAADPGEEPDDNGGRINQGAFGGTPQATRSAE